jgi:hypothetical protein
MFVCDLCRKQLDGMSTIPHISDSRNGKRICVECVKLCVEIVNDESTAKIVYINQYREERERKRRLE